MSHVSAVLRFEDHEQLARYFQGAVIDDSGREIPITDAMIQDACEQLEYLDSAIHQHAKCAQQATLYSR